MTGIADDVLSELTEDFAKDQGKENNGVWMTYKRFKYLIARAHRNNVAFQKEMEFQLRPYQWAIDRQNMAALRNLADTMLREVYAKTILLAVARVTEADGTPSVNQDGSPKRLAYTPEVGVALFNKLPGLWDEVYRFSNAEDNYSPDTIKADSKN